PSAGFAAGAHTLIIGFGDRKVSDLQKSINNPVGGGTKFHGLNMFNYDVRSLGVSGSGKWYVLNSTDAIISTGGVPTTKAITATSIANVTSSQALINLNSTGTDPQRTNDRIFALTSSNFVGLMFNYTATTALTTADKPIVTDFFSFGIKGDGDAESDRVNNAVYRSELEETGADTGTFTGTIEYLMLNQINIFADGTYSQIRAINHEVKFVAHEDLIQADARAVRLNYFDKGSDGVDTQIAAQQDAPTHSGTVSFDNKNYKVADTVTITVKDQDLNVDNDLIDIYTTVAGDAATLPAAQDGAADTIGVAGEFRTSTNTAFGRLLDVQFGQGNIRWQKSSACTAPNLGLSDQGFTLVENGKNTGIFTGTFQIPQTVCQETTTADNAQVNTNGLNIKVNYVDFRDASGKTIEVSDRAGVRGTTGSVKLDRTVYPVPFGQFSDFSFAANKDTPSGRAIFPLHKTALGGSSIDSADKTVGNGDLTIHVRVNDRDFDLSAAGEDKIGLGNSTTSDGPAGPVKVTVSRGTDTVVLARMGGPAAKDGPIGVGANFNTTGVRELGPMIEIAPDAGIFQGDLVIRYTDGPAGSNCPQTSTYTPLKHFEADGVTEIVGSDTLGTTRFSDSFKTTPSNTGYCIRQGDILTVQYTDPVDASGHSNTVTDSATFDLRNGVLQSDKSVYIIGSDMILTLIEPDFNLDSQSAETKSLDLIELDSHAAKVTMGTKGQQTAQFDAKPSDFRETGKDTGIFQSVIRIPKQLSSSGGASGTLLERGEQIHLEYTDWAPAGAKFIGDENQDIKLTIYTSNFGATVELDQKVYTWTDKVYITVVAPDHNFDSNLIDEIGSADENKIVVATRGQKISPYKLVETGVDTGVFTGEVILTGFDHEVDEAKNKPTFTGPSGVGPTDGFLPASDIDGVTVSFLYTKDQTVTGSALIRWNIGEVQFVEASYPANGQGVLRIIDPDMNLNPEAVDKFDTNMWSDSDAGGIKLTMTETNEATGIFEGTVYFTTQFQSSGNRLKVNEGDTVTGEYLDKTLPQPYTPADQLRITATTFIGTVVPPLERAPASNPRIVDAFGNELKEVKVDQQVQITADLANGQDKTQPFAYLVQIQDSNGVTVSLSWITGSLTAGQSLNPAQSWTPSAAGSYTAQIFVWESVDNPNALSPPVSTTITVV
ncbi:MAG: hypothetical protein HY295_04370, partial [Thaumarchaeota archaeon]|nr:hypothetical protein [Nitrososphaerota archaeon]